MPLPTPAPGVKRIFTSRPCTSITASSSCGGESDQHGAIDTQDDDNIMAQTAATSLAQRTERKVQDFLERSQWIRNHSRLADIPRLEASDFTVSKVIAEGGFSDIREITAFHNTIKNFNKAEHPQQQIQPEDEKQAENDSDDTPTTTSTTVTLSYSNNNKKRYVLKHLKPELALNQYKLKCAAKDICNEIQVLSALDHEHIVQVEGLSSAGISGFQETCRADSFFLILERLDQTLMHKMSQWRHDGVRMQALSLDKLGSCPRTLGFFRERILVAKQLASALRYLHERRILHRDIKPGNVGFDAEGSLKLFDFGLAVELPPSDDPLATYDLGNAGTARYQAPEVIKKKPYNAASESYSFSLLLWEIVALTKVFQCLSAAEVKESVALIGFRPAISRSWPKALNALLQKGWSKKWSRRPTMADMEAALGKIAEAEYSKKPASKWFPKLK